MIVSTVSAHYIRFPNAILRHVSHQVSSCCAHVIKRSSVTHLVEAAKRYKQYSLHMFCLEVFNIGYQTSRYFLQRNNHILLFLLHLKILP
ncbi:hypothetical protein ACS0PU_005389 [Formica fusca]